MMLPWFSVYFFTHFIVLKCSRAIDEHRHGEKSLQVTDYCPKIGSCEEGTHVMCLHYNPKRVMGPSCSGDVTVTITPDYAQMILDIMNRIRSKVTKGTIKGSDGVDLPRGYGIYRLSWDEELATFAQVWANQCKMTSDLCRCSERFPNVGQALGMCRFTIDDWQPINAPGQFNSTTIDPDKVKYAILSVMKAWYGMKSDVTPAIVKQLDERPPSMFLNKFLHLVYGNVTHIGCGISAYREFAYHTNSVPLNYNSIQIVCNFSSRFQSGTPIYNTDPPTENGYTVRCGCPLGYDEDEDCLCYESGRQLPYSCKNNSRCKPEVVVFPIFTENDAPRRDQELSNRAVQKYPADVKNRYFGMKRPSRKIHHHDKTPDRGSKVARRRSKQSIFSIAPIFELSIRKTELIRQPKPIEQVTHQTIVKNYKKDVEPRKDFTEVRKLVSKYLDKKRNSKPINFDEESNGYITYGPLTLKSINIPNVEILENTTSLRLSRNDFYVKQKFGGSHFNTTKTLENMYDIKFANEDPDRKLISLLNKLEKEIKEKDLNEDDKVIFNTKIHQIYETLVGKTDFEVKHKPDIVLDNNSRIDEKVNPDNRKRYRDEYLESIRPRNSHRDIKERFTNHKNKFKMNSSKEDNIDSIKNPFYNYNDLEGRRMRNLHNVRKQNRRFHNDNYNLRNDEEDILDIDRRRYYDNKLANLRRKLDMMKINGYQNKAIKMHKDRKMRPVRPTKSIDEQATQIRPKDAMNAFYIGDRARSLQGF